MAKGRKEIWIGLLVVVMGLIPVALVALWGYMRVTATPLHPVPQEIPSVLRTRPAAAWDEAIGQGREIVRAALSTQNLPGLSVAVGVAGDIVWAEGFGLADLDNALPVTPETQFRIGTASTVLTSAAVGLLVENSRLALDQEIQLAVPEFPQKDWPVTLRQLMASTAGVRNDGGDEGPLLAARCDRPVEAFPSFADRPLLFEPGIRYRYSSYGWVVVSAAVEGAAGQPFLEFIRTQILGPLNLWDTEADSATEPTPNRATLYFPRFASDPRYGLHLMRPLDYSCYSGASVFLSTPSDLVRFGLAVNGGRLLQPGTASLLQTPQRLASGEETGHGLGWDVGAVTLASGEARTFGVDGTSLGGMVASLLTLPDRGVAVSVMSNISYADTRAVAAAVAQRFTEPTPGSGH